MTQTAVSTRDGVGSGITIVSAFGVLWAIMAVSGLDIPTALRVVLIVAALAGGWAVLYTARTTRVAHASEAPERRRSPHSRQIFNYVNTAQSVLIVAGAVACGSTHHQSLIPPVIAVIVGLHFLPLAHAFGLSLFWVTGAVLCTIAALGLVVALTTGPQNLSSYVIVGFPASATLWTTALLMARRS